ncbi:MAG: phenolic acid decarboxylase subunit B, partial [Desulfovibrio sp.]|nr:phenolic acid decarboxylase subunit B [Desulfovibrio sp.]
PCSMSSLAAIATGAGTNLIHRAADVALKERRPLILAIRETPYSLIHIRNMLAATEAGATIMPFNPAYYSGDDTLEGLARQFAGRLLDQLRLPHNLCRRWGEN